MITTSIFPYRSRKYETADEAAKATLHSLDSVQPELSWHEDPVRTTSDGSGMGTQDRTVSVNPACCNYGHVWGRKTILRPAGRAWVSGNADHGVDAPPLAATDGQKYMLPYLT
jgi:hypothetical protein